MKDKILAKRLAEVKFSKLSFNPNVLETDDRHWARCIAGFFLDVLELEKFDLLVLRDIGEHINKIEKITIFPCGCCSFSNPFYEDIDKRLQEIKVMIQQFTNFAKRTGKKDFDFDKEFAAIEVK